MLGQTISHYTIIEKIGGGGMGVVYRADDTKLKRSVALKFLPYGFVQDEESKQRFIREAQAASALQHNNICVIHDIDETADGQLFIVMDLYQGGTLKDTIASGKLTLPDTLQYAIHIAEGLSEAHKHNIIHRDIKPANIMISQNGVAKIVDFGLAKLADVSRVSKSGNTPGTIAYMSPEQLKGEDADERSDIFSFGIVLFEMLTGTTPFRGDIEPLMMYSILNDEPEPIENFRNDIPEMLINLIERCLEKDPADRYQSTREIVTEIHRIQKRTGYVSRSDHSSHIIQDKNIIIGRYGQSVKRRSSRRLLFERGRWRLNLLISLAAVGSIAVLTLSIIRLLAVNEPEMKLKSVEKITLQDGDVNWPSISPNGENVIYQKTEGNHIHIFQQRLGSSNAVNLTQKSNSDNLHPTYSPSGEQIAFASTRDSGGIFVMGASGESVRRVTNFGYHPSWSPDERSLIFVDVNSNSPYGPRVPPTFRIVDIRSGEMKIVPSKSSFHPKWSPHGLRIVFSVAGSLYTSTPSGDLNVLTDTARSMHWAPSWSSDGRYIYYESDQYGNFNLWRIAVDEETGYSRGEGTPLLLPSEFSASYSVSSDNRKIVYVSRKLTTVYFKTGLDPNNAKIIGPPIDVGTVPGEVPYEDLSPDGEWITFNSNDKFQDLYVMRSNGTDLRKLTIDKKKDRAPQWSHDGNRIVFYSTRSDSTPNFNIWSINKDGSNLTPLTKTIPGATEPSLSPDGRTLMLFQLYDEASGFVDLTLPLEQRTLKYLPPIDSGGSRLRGFSWSSDGKYVSGFVLKKFGTSGGVYIYSIPEKKFFKVRFPSHLLSNDLQRIGFSQWLRDNRTFIVQTDDELFIVDARTAQARQICNVKSLTNNSCMVIGCTADGTTLYFRRTMNQDNLWLATFTVRE